MTQALNKLPALGAEIHGGIYAGVSTDKTGELYMLVLLADKPAKDLAWKPAMAWAKKLDADLPSRVESALLFANLREKFTKEWHWTNEEHEADASYAWLCYFNYGHQYYDLKSAEGAARAVRRLPLRSFNPLDGALKHTAERVGQLRDAARTLLAACDSVEVAEALEAA